MGALCCNCCRDIKAFLAEIEGEQFTNMGFVIND